METNQKFDTKKCLNYINQIKDFEIELARKPGYDARGRMLVYLAERISIKAFLKKFIIECMQQSRRDDYDFLDWLSFRKLMWKNQQYHILGSLAERMARAEREDKPFLRKKQDMYNDFYTHSRKMIEIIEDDMLNAIDISGAGHIHDLPESAAPVLHQKITGAKSAKLVQQDLALLCALDDADISTYVIQPGRKLLQHCNAYKDRRKRTEILPEMSFAMAMHVRRRYEKVMPHLKTEEGKKRAMEELEIVQKKMKETHFEK